MPVSRRALPCCWGKKEVAAGAAEVMMLLPMMAPATVGMAVLTAPAGSGGAEGSGCWAPVLMVATMVSPEDTRSLGAGLWLITCPGKTNALGAVVTSKVRDLLRAVSLACRSVMFLRSGVFTFLMGGGGS